jgi:carbon-monoxide dehydrogenase medium subunit
MRPACVEYVAATSVDEVLDALADGTTEVLAGGQSLILEMSTRDEPPRRVVDINGRAAGQAPGVRVRDGRWAAR